MQLLRKADSTAFTNGPTCEGVEYSFSDKSMNIAVVTVNGRYPEEGYVMNEVCKEMGYIVSGVGKLRGKDGNELPVAIGDTVFIAPGEAYFWEGESLVMVMPCAPAFYPEQHKKVG